MTSTSFDLTRFVDAQAVVYPEVVAQLRAGRKSSHWMWFIFPQLAALGRSSTARFYGLVDASHAVAYGTHPGLGPRLKECSALVAANRTRTAQQIFGSPDDLKLCSCMTLFDAAMPDESVFAEVLDRFFAGKRDDLTLARLHGTP
jgi:uncharacterized protein (DUF1810 family)